MELNELKSMWQAREATLEKSAKLNTQLLDKIESGKIQSILKPLLVQNKIVLFLHILFMAGLLIFFVYHIAELPYAASAFVLLLFYVYLTVNCIQQIKAIRNVDLCTDIIGKQTALAELNTHILHYPRLSLLSIPVFLSFPVVVMKALIDLRLNYFDGLDIITHTQGKWWTVELIVYLLFIPTGIWFYQQVKPANMHKPWVKNIIRGVSSKKVYKAARFLEELEGLKKEK
ncbi:MAG: hypothetical protein ABI921_11065 [Panacibacter sp.]